MKSLIYIHQYFRFPDVTGGTRSYDLSKEFIKNGMKVIVLTSTSINKSSKKWHIYERDGIEIHEIFIPYSNSFSSLKRMKCFLLFIFYTSFHLLKLNTDAVLATSTPLTIGVPALINKWLKRTPYIFEVRDVWPEAVVAIGEIKSKWLQRILYKLEFLIYKNADYIVPLSTDMQKSIVNRFPQFKKKCDIVVENIAEVNRFQNNKETVDLEKVIGIKPRFSVLYAGAFGKVNDLSKIVEWAEIIYSIDSSICFILIGFGAEKNNVIQYAKDKKVFNKNVFILDSISKNELPKWYNAVDMGSSFVTDIKELWANSANKFFDTLASGKPILINHQGWQEKCITDNDIGFILSTTPNFKKANEFVNYTNSNEFTAINKRALDTAKNKFSLEIASIKYESILKKII